MSPASDNQGTGSGPIDLEQEDTVKLPGLGNLELPEEAAPVQPSAPAGEGLGATVSAAVVQDALEEVSRLHKQLAGLRAVVHERDERLQSMDRELAARDEQIKDLRARTHNQYLELQRVAAERDTPPETTPTPTPADEGRLEQPWHELRTRAERYREALQHADGYRLIFESVIEEHEADARKAWARVASLERQLVGRVQEAESDTATLRVARDRVRELEEKLNTTAAGTEQAIATADQSALGQAQARMAELEGELRGWEQVIRTLYEERSAAEQREQKLHRELADREAQLIGLRAAEQEMRLQLSRVSEKLAEQAPRPGPAARPALPVVAESKSGMSARLLVRTTGTTGIVHVLAHRTTVGRTPDNTLQLDAEFISRHHAVLLESPAGTIIEDLASTNGVYVNGQRVSRQLLKSGDRVTIGRSDFRFIVKPPSGAQD